MRRHQFPDCLFFEFRAVAGHFFTPIAPSNINEKRADIYCDRGGSPETFMSMGRVAVYFEAAVVIISLTLFGQILELRARSQTSAAIKSLLGLAPKTARRINADGSEEDVPLTHVHEGDRLRVRPGEKVPVDGIVEDGASSLDESMGNPPIFNGAQK